MSATSSPLKLKKKQSLSILSCSNLNQLNNKTEIAKTPRKERIVSESTGLIKFSLQKSENIDNKENVTYSQGMKSERHNYAESSPERETNCIPIYVPIDETKTENCFGSTDEILFQMAAKQRNVLDLEQQLKQANIELAELEAEYKRRTVDNAESSNLTHETKQFTTPQRLASVAQTIRKSTSLMSINITAPRINEDLQKTQKQMTDTFHLFTNNLSKNNFFSKSKDFLESNFQQKVQKGNEILNSIFERSDSAEEDSFSPDELTEAFDYSVDLDINHLSNMAVSKHFKRAMLDDLEETNEESEYIPESLKRTSTSFSDYSEDDYGGAPTAI